ncbi:hypothetical protein PCE1_004650 [Barthelona sp. PCE]
MGSTFMRDVMELKKDHKNKSSNVLYSNPQIEELNTDILHAFSTILSMALQEDENDLHITICIILDHFSSHINLKCLDFFTDEYCQFVVCYNLILMADKHYFIPQKVFSFLPPKKGELPSYNLPNSKTFNELNEKKMGHNMNILAFLLDFLKSKNYRLSIHEQWLKSLVVGLNNILGDKKQVSPEWITEIITTLIEKQGIVLVERMNMFSSVNLRRKAFNSTASKPQSSNKYAKKVSATREFSPSPIQFLPSVPFTPKQNNQQTTPAPDVERIPRTSLALFFSEFLDKEIALCGDIASFCVPHPESIPGFELFMMQTLISKVRDTVAGVSTMLPFKNGILYVNLVLLSAINCIFGLVPIFPKKDGELSNIIITIKYLENFLQQLNHCLVAIDNEHTVFLVISCFISLWKYIPDCLLPTFEEFINSISSLITIMSFISYFNLCFYMEDINIVLSFTKSNERNDSDKEYDAFFLQHINNIHYIRLFSPALFALKQSYDTLFQKNSVEATISSSENQQKKKKRKVLVLKKKEKNEKQIFSPQKIPVTKSVYNSILHVFSQEKQDLLYRIIDSFMLEKREEWSFVVIDDICERYMAVVTAMFPLEPRSVLLFSKTQLFELLKERIPKSKPIIRNDQKRIFHSSFGEYISSIDRCIALIHDSDVRSIHRAMTVLCELISKGNEILPQGILTSIQSLNHFLKIMVSLIVVLSMKDLDADIFEQISVVIHRA